MIRPTPRPKDMPYSRTATATSIICTIPNELFGRLRKNISPWRSSSGIKHYFMAPSQSVLPPKKLGPPNHLLKQILRATMTGSSNLMLAVRSRVPRGIRFILRTIRQESDRPTWSSSIIHQAKTSAPNICRHRTSSKTSTPRRSLRRWPKKNWIFAI